jgi:hypothetical protein
MGMGNWSLDGRLEGKGKGRKVVRVSIVVYIAFTETLSVIFHPCKLKTNGRRCYEVSHITLHNPQDIQPHPSPSYIFFPLSMSLGPC